MGYRKRTLEMQADMIEAVLARHKVTGKVNGGVVTPRFVRFELSTGLGTKVSKVAALAGRLMIHFFSAGFDASTKLKLGRKVRAMPSMVVPDRKRYARFGGIVSALSVAI